MSYVCVLHCKEALEKVEMAPCNTLKAFKLQEISEKTFAVKERSYKIDLLIEKGFCSLKTTLNSTRTNLGFYL